MMKLATFVILGLSFGSVNACDTHPTAMSSNEAASPAENVGIYTWNESQQLWTNQSISLVNDILYDYTAEPGDELIATGTYSGGGGGGGGGGTQPQFAATSDCDPITLPPVTVSAPRPSTGSFAFLTRVTSYYPNQNGGGGTWKIFRRVTSGRADHPNNQTRATCQSDEDDRYYHSAQDFAYWRLQTFGNAVRSGRGERITVVYDDGGTEVYTWIPGRIPSSTSPPETYLARVPNSLKCPS